MGDDVAEGAVGQGGEQAAVGHAVHVAVGRADAHGQHVVGLAPVEAAQVRQVTHELAAGVPGREAGGNGVCHEDEGCLLRNVPR